MSTLLSQLESIILPPAVMKFSAEKDHYGDERYWSNFDNPIMGANVFTPAAKHYISTVLSGDGFQYISFNYKTKKLKLDVDSLLGNIHSGMKNGVDQIMFKTTNRKFYDSIRYDIATLLSKDDYLLEILSDYIIVKGLNDLTEPELKVNEHANNIVAILNELVKKEVGNGSRS